MSQLRQAKHPWVILGAALADFTQEQPSIQALCQHSFPEMSMHARRPREIRQLVQQQFAELLPTSGPITDEALLIRDGQYCGHRYHTASLTAVWFLEEDQIKIYDETGHVISLICPSETALDIQTDAA